MLPLFLDLKVLKVYTFGVFLLLAFFWASYLLWKNFLLTTHKEEEVFDGLFISLALGLFVSRSLYVLLHFADFGFSFLKFILINGYPGLSLYGFIAGFLLGLYLYFLSKKVKLREVVDYFVPSAFLALALAEIGVFFSGPQTKLEMKLVFLNFLPLAESALFFLGAFLSYKILYAIRREKYFKGFNFFYFFWYYSLIRSVSDFLLGGKRAFLSLDFDLILSFALLLTTTFYFLYYFRSLVFGNFNALISQVRKKNDKKDHKNVHQGIQGTSGKR
jgi:prolipoprotein diacylglyceryltransferase